MKMIQQYDVTRLVNQEDILTSQLFIVYLNLSLQMYNSTILKQKLNHDTPDHNDQNVFEISFASVFS